MIKVTNKQLAKELMRNNVELQERRGSHYYFKETPQNLKLHAILSKEVNRRDIEWLMKAK